MTTRTKAKAKAQDVFDMQEDKKAEALRLIHKLGKQVHSLALVSLSFRASADPFAKVKGMIEDMLQKLLQEASEEAEQKAFCDRETSQTKEAVEQKTEKLNTASARISKAESQVERLNGEIGSLTKQVAEMDTALAEATKIR